MPNKVFKHLELTGTSSTSIEDAVQSAIARASKTVRNIRWMQITETRGQVDEGKVVQWQVTLKAGFALDE
jgi:hypothetical protein